MVNPGTAGRLLSGRYRLHEPLGRGGMGTVWRGTDEVLGRDVAVKEVVYPPEVAESDRQMLRERTLREARAVARITHPSVVTVYDVVREDERPWIVMELVTGRSLADLVESEGPLPTGRAAAIGLELLAAVERAHDVGVLHRDLKPANVLLADDGRVVLTDFGIAAVEGDPRLTSTGLVLGSPAFMAPERARSEEPGPAADLWGVGSTLYAAVEGRPPFDRTGPLATVTALVTEDPDPMTVTGPLREAVERLLVKDPAARLGVAAARGLLQRATGVPAPEGDEPPGPGVVQGAPTPPGTDVPTAARSRRLRGVLGLAAAAVVVASIVAYGFAGPETGAGGDRAGTGGSPGPSPAASDRTSPADATPGPSGRGGSPGVPAGFERHRDPTGFSVAVPRGWHVVREGGRVDFREPGGAGRFLRIDQTDEPAGDPVADWKGQERSFRARYPDYRRIRIEAVDYRTYDAADWEFEFVTGGGRRLHVLDRAAVTSRDHAYAIYWSTPADRWAESRRYFEVFARTFRPAG